MNRIVMIALAVGAAATACGRTGDRQNSALCGITMVASGNRVLDQLYQNSHAILTDAPEELKQASIPTRVIGHGTATSLGAAGDSGAVLGYEGEGLPETPGFGLALVDDSSEVFRGVVVFETDPPAAYPTIGTISSAVSTLPLFGMRIHWSSVNSEECPIFATPGGSDSSGA